MVPAAPEWPIQIVHARDLADWVVDMAERREGGTFNAVSEPRPMMSVLVEIRAVTGSDAEFVAVDEQFLLDAGIEPWDGLPLWLAAFSNPDFAGMMAVDTSRAKAAGFRARPLADAILQVLAWEAEPVSKDYGAGGAASGLDAGKERELLDAWANLKSCGSP